MCTVVCMCSCGFSMVCSVFKLKNRAKQCFLLFSIVGVCLFSGWDCRSMAVGFSRSLCPSVYYAIFLPCASCIHNFFSLWLLGHHLYQEAFPFPQTRMDVLWIIPKAFCAKSDDWNILFLSPLPELLLFQGQRAIPLVRESRFILNPSLVIYAQMVFWWWLNVTNDILKNLA